MPCHGLVARGRDDAHDLGSHQRNCSRMMDPSRSVLTKTGTSGIPLGLRPSTPPLICSSPGGVLTCPVRCRSSVNVCLALGLGSSSLASSFTSGGAGVSMMMESEVVSIAIVTRHEGRAAGATKTCPC